MHCISNRFSVHLWHLNRPKFCELPCDHPRADWGKTDDDHENAWLSVRYLISPALGMFEMLVGLVPHPIEQWWPIAVALHFAGNFERCRVQHGMPIALQWSSLKPYQCIWSMPADIHRWKWVDVDHRRLAWSGTCGMNDNIFESHWKNHKRLQLNTLTKARGIHVECKSFAEFQRHHCHQRWRFVAGLVDELMVLSSSSPVYRQNIPVAAIELKRKRKNKLMGLFKESKVAQSQLTDKLDTRFVFCLFLRVGRSKHLYIERYHFVNKWWQWIFWMFPGHRPSFLHAQLIENRNRRFFQCRHDAVVWFQH